MRYSRWVKVGLPLGGTVPSSTWKIRFSSKSDGIQSFSVLSAKWMITSLFLTSSLFSVNSSCITLPSKMISSSSFLAACFGWGTGHGVSRSTQHTHCGEVPFWNLGPSLEGYLYFSCLQPCVTCLENNPWFAFLWSCRFQYTKTKSISFSSRIFLWIRKRTK